MKTLNDYTLSGLEIELKIRFGSDWKNALIEEEGYNLRDLEMINNGKWDSEIKLCSDVIWNKNGLIYKNGKWASRKLTELPEKFCIESENKGEYWLYNKEGKIGIAYFIRKCEGYQLITPSQLKRIKDIPKIGDVGVFWDNDYPQTKIIGTLFKINNCKFETQTCEWYENFQPIADLQHIEIIKQYLDN